MALVTRPKPAVYHKKRRAQHHRHSEIYVKAYWPYLPMLAIVGTGAVVNKLWASGANTALALNPRLATAQLTRVQALTGDQTGRVLEVAILVTFAALVLFVIRHSRRLHRLVLEGEAFVSDHPWLDIVTVFVFTAGFVLTRYTTS
jgi:hypothetical protein